MNEDRVNELMAMPIPQKVIRAYMSLNGCDELDARRFFESNKTCLRIAMAVYDECKRKESNVKKYSYGRNHRI